MNNKTILIITDGIGHNPSDKHNAFVSAKKPFYDYAFENIPYSLIKTSGNAVGLPEGQMGNSEVGHMTIGSGRVLYQNLVKINKAIDDDNLKDNSDLKEILNKSNDIHILALMSDGGVHSDINHIIALAKIAEIAGKKTWLHMITDGRDVSPTSSVKYLNQILDICNDNIKIATISGRFYTMDRDKRWERVEQGYNQVISASNHSDLDIEEFINQSYQADITDEFLIPTSFNGYKGMQDNDGLICANFRNDRMREIVEAIGFDEFTGFNRDKKVNANILTMTEYDADFPYPIIFKKDAIKNTLAEVISNAGLTQLHTAETEKYAHVTFFFNGGVEQEFTGEDRALVPSPDVKTYDLQPEMNADIVGKGVRDGMDKEYDFIVVNFANGDMVGHTGNFNATVKAVEAVDHELGLIFDKAKKQGYNVILTSDHGNVEAMENEAGDVLTNHTTFDVYCFILAESVDKVKVGGLNNIAPTIVKLMGLDEVTEMDVGLI